MDFRLVVDNKRIHDIVHGYILISNLAQRVIDNRLFQRLRFQKQLGTCYFVFPNTNHTRFEHSIGTYHLAGKLMSCIMERTKPSDIEEYLKSIPELLNYFQRTYNGYPLLDKYICELVKIAGLCHDIGHGPFSHVFDDIFLKDSSHMNRSHETRSILLIEKIIKEDPILSEVIQKPEIDFIKSLIHPSKKNTGFLYQIVSNYLNGLDVDKFDYISRDSLMTGFKTGFDFSRLVNDIYIIDNMICYPEQVSFEVYRMYLSRYQLHKQIYNHKAVVAAQVMLIELMNILDPYIKLSNSLDSMDNFAKFTDSYLLECIHFLEPTDPNIIKAMNILNRLNSHNLYKCIGIKYSSKDFKSKLKSDTKYVSEQKSGLGLGLGPGSGPVINQIVNKEGGDELGVYVGREGGRGGEEELDPDSSPSDSKPKLEDFMKMTDIIVQSGRIGFVSGNKSNPLKNIHIYHNKHSDNTKQRKKLECKDISNLMPTTYQEYYYMVFTKSLDVDSIKAAKDLFREDN